MTARGTRVGERYHIAEPMSPGQGVYITDGGLKAQVAAVQGRFDADSSGICYYVAVLGLGTSCGKHRSIQAPG